MVVFLSHPLRADPLALEARLAQVARGAAALWPARTFRRWSGPWTGAAPAAARRRRLIAGDGPPARWPDGPIGPLAPPDGSAMPPADCVWACGPLCADVASDIRFAASLGVPVAHLDAALVGQLAAAGEAVRSRAASSAAALTASRALAGLPDDDRDFRGPLAVIRAWFLCTTWRLGGGAARMEDDGGRTSAEPFAVRAEGVALRIARAGAIVHAARLSRRELDALRLRELDGRTWRQVALALGLPDDDAADRRAERVVAGALRRIRRALRDQEAA